MVKVRRSLTAISVMLAVCLPLASLQAAPVFDGYFQVEQKKNAEGWAAEDTKINEKLVELEKRFGKKPNIIYILADDVGWGELGWQGGGKHRGTPTPTLDTMAKEGMAFWSAYAEPSCTPSRIAINTGRHPVRTGLLSVLWPGQIDGLSPKEETIAEVLSGSGYHTAMWGKWHLGDLPEHAPENQGYDYAYYGLFNGAPDAWPASEIYTEQPTPVKAPFFDFPGVEEYKKMTGIDLSIAGYIGEKGKGRKPIEGAAGKLGIERQETFEEESIKQITSYIKKNAKSNKPFFIYWATYCAQIHGSKKHMNDPYVDKVNAQASEMAAHNAHVKQMLDTLKAEGIAENTYFIYCSDNGRPFPRCKTRLYDSGIKTPFVVHYPRRVKPGVTASLVGERSLPAGRYRQLRLRVASAELELVNEQLQQADPARWGLGGRVGDLAEAILLETPGQKLAYATDFADTSDNRRRLVALAAGAQAFGVHPEMVKVASQMALIPIWFLAVYLFVVLLVPVVLAVYGFARAAMRRSSRCQSASSSPRWA